MTERILWVTTDDLVKHFTITKADVYHWAHLDGWRSTRTRPNRYAYADALKSYDTRKRQVHA